MSSSREVTAQKKKDVWEEAGSEFYQESYPSGSKAPNNTHQRRPSRLAIPLPSQTARRGSLLNGRQNNKTGGRRRQTNVTGGRSGFTYTSTMAATTDVNGTTTNANDIQVAILPDLSEETILNERKTWEELMRIKAMPVPMAQKKQLKAQLANLPKLRLKGWANIKFMFSKTWKQFSNSAIHYYRHISFLDNSLRRIELRSGTAVVNVFLFIKWTLFLNMAISLALIAFVIGPYIAHDIINGKHDFSPSDAETCSVTDEGPGVSLDDTDHLQRFLDCCQAQYESELQNPNVTRGTVSSLFKAMAMGNIELWPVSVGHYHRSTISYNNSKNTYPFSVMYVLTGCGIFACCLILLVYSIAQGVKEIINLREGEFYKYSNLIFAGWEHCTNEDAGAQFKRLVLRNEMKIALQMEKKKINNLMKTKRQRFKLYFLRVSVNITVLVLLIGASAIIFQVTIRFTNVRQAGNTDTSKTLDNYAKGFAPSVVIAFFNLIFPVILAKMGKLEQFSREWETALVLLRALFIRVFALFSVLSAFYKYSYCVPEEGYCTKCDIDATAKELISVGPKNEIPANRTFCWEAEFADQMYRIILTELLVKVLLTFIVDPLRKALKMCCKNKLAQRIGTMSFNIIRHSLDVIYIQVLSWMSFHNAPFSPIIAVFYCFFIFYIKKFSVLYNCKYVPDTFRTTKTTAVFMMAKIISFVVVFFIYAYTVGFMVPSRECGPFRGRSSAWQTVQLHFENYPQLYEFFIFASSPGVATPIALVLILLAYYYYSVAQANRAMVETLRHLLILEGHDKQYLFAKLNSLRRGDSDKKAAFKSRQLAQYEKDRPTTGVTTATSTVTRRGSNTSNITLSRKKVSNVDLS